MTNKTKSNIIKGASLTLCVGAPLVATLCQFPVWVDKSAEATMSGTFIFLAFLCCIPFIRQIKAFFKSPAAWLMWTIVCVSMIALRLIIDQIIIVALIGAIANLIGAVGFKIADKINEKEKVTDGTN